MRLSKQGYQLIKDFEGCRLEAYPDPATGAEPYTIGFGQTGHGIYKGLKWTQKQADEALVAEVERLEKSLNALLKVTVSQGEYDALISFAFNLGIGNLMTSTLLKLVNASDFIGASQEFVRWNKANGKVMAGLTRRRLAEKARFLS